MNTISKERQRERIPSEAKSFKMSNVIISNNINIDTKELEEVKDIKLLPASLTPIEIKAELALSEAFYLTEWDKETQKRIEAVNKHIKERALRISKGNNKGIAWGEKAGIARATINIRKLAEKLYGSIGGAQILETKRVLKSLANKKLRWIIPINENDKVVLKVPLFYHSFEKSYVRNGKEIITDIDIFFEDVFVYHINKRFTLFPKNIYSLINDKRTEIFSKLLLLLAYQRGIKTKEAARFKDEHGNTIAAAMIYKESLGSIFENRVSNKEPYIQEKNGKQYVRKSRFKKHFNEAVEALKETRLLVGYEERKNRKEETICIFKLNPRWEIEQK